MAMNISEKYRLTLTVVRGMLLGAAIYWLAAAAGIPKIHVVLAPLLAGMMGSAWQGRMRWRMLGGVMAALLAVLLVLLYYFAVAPYATSKLLSAGLIGLLPLPVAMVFGLLGAAMWEGFRGFLEDSS